MLMQRGLKSLNGFQFGTFIGHVLNDGVASMALKGLNKSNERTKLPQVVWCTQNLRRDGSSFMWHQPRQRDEYTTSVDIQKTRYKKAIVIHVGFFFKGNRGKNSKQREVEPSAINNTAQRQIIIRRFDILKYFLFKNKQTNNNNNSPKYK